MGIEDQEVERVQGPAPRAGLGTVKSGSRRERSFHGQPPCLFPPEPPEWKGGRGSESPKSVKNFAFMVWGGGYLLKGDALEGLWKYHLFVPSPWW